MTSPAIPLLTRANATQMNYARRIRMCRTRLKTARSAVRSRPCRQHRRWSGRQTQGSGGRRRLGLGQWGRSWLLGGDAPFGEQRQQGDQGEHHERGAEPVEPCLLVGLQSRGGDLLAHICLVERGLEVGVGEERHAAGKLDIGLALTESGTANPARSLVHLSGSINLADVLAAFEGTTYRPVVQRGA